MSNDIDMNPPWEDASDTKKSSAAAEEATPARRGAPVAIDGKRANVNDYPEAELPLFPGQERKKNARGEVEIDSSRERYISQQYDPNTGVDFVDLSALNTQINRARKALFDANAALARAERTEARREYEYRRAHARALVSLSGGSEKQRIAYADVDTEAEYGELLVARTLVKECVNQVRALRTELDVLTVMSHNLRAQMQLQ